MFKSISIQSKQKTEKKMSGNQGRESDFEWRQGYNQSNYSTTKKRKSNNEQAKTQFYEMNEFFHKCVQNSKKGIRLNMAQMKLQDPIEVT